MDAEFVKQVVFGMIQNGDLSFQFKKTKNIRYTGGFKEELVVKGRILNEHNKVSKKTLQVVLVNKKWESNK